MLNHGTLGWTTQTVQTKIRHDPEVVGPGCGIDGPKSQGLNLISFGLNIDPVFPFIHISIRFWSLVSSPLHISHYITFDNYIHRFLFIWIPQLYNNSPLLPTYSPNEWLQEKSGFISLFRFKTSKNSGCPHKRALTFFLKSNHSPSIVWDGWEQSWNFGVNIDYLEDHHY